MRQRSIQETFRAVSPKKSGNSVTSSLSLGFGGSGGGFSTALTTAAQEISQLRATYQSQVDFLKANTAALEKGQTQGGSGNPVTNSLKSAAQGVLGGGGLLGAFPLISGIAKLFGGGDDSTPAPFPLYQLPPSVNLDGTVSAKGFGNSNPTGTSVASLQSGSGSSASHSSANSTTQHVTVNIQALDSQSILDRSSDIANAVRQAVLNLHPLNSVIADL